MAVKAELAATPGEEGGGCGRHMTGSALCFMGRVRGRVGGKGPEGRGEEAHGVEGRWGGVKHTHVWERAGGAGRLVFWCGVFVVAGRSGAGRRDGMGGWSMLFVGVGGRRAGGRESMKSDVKRRRRVRALWVFVHSCGSSATASVLGLAAAGSVHDGASTSGSGPGGAHVRPSHCCCPAPRRPHGRPPLCMARRLPKTGATTTISSLSRHRRRVPLSHRHFVTLPNSHVFPQAPSPSGRLGVHLRAQRRRRPRFVVASWPSFAASCF